ncbi:hypothetical protein F5878DRAFT_630588 [Lentinula raphanica]|uniref:Uncharacterized protein n=1 Tax=Lentinula raphanica TaxID=153919 RepID=A0AA38P166_9AGAR|nr:hypothetical protein F5878DRAFT_630588 [Lentinula raphanica]
MRWSRQAAWLFRANFDQTTRSRSRFSSHRHLRRKPQKAFFMRTMRVVSHSTICVQTELTFEFRKSIIKFSRISTLAEARRLVYLTSPIAAQFLLGRRPLSVMDHASLLNRLEGNVWCWDFEQAHNADFRPSVVVRVKPASLRLDSNLPSLELSTRN